METDIEGIFTITEDIRLTGQTLLHGTVNYIRFDTWDAIGVYDEKDNLLELYNWDNIVKVIYKKVEDSDE